MKYRLLNFLVCPICGNSLQLTIFEEAVLSTCTAAGEDRCAKCAQKEIMQGLMHCSCGRMYPVLDAVPVLLTENSTSLEKLHARYPDRFQLQAGCSANRTRSLQEEERTKQRFGYEWMRYPTCFAAEEENIFFDETQLAPAELKNSLTLDAGCGMGRFTRAAGAQGGEVIGVDLSESVYRAFELTKQMPHVHIVQADLMRLPFRAESFDIIYSLGVLHHTPDTAKAFSSVARYVKPGGLLSIWVYGTAGKYADFISNPLRPERLRFMKSGLIQRIYWLLVLAREKCSNALRGITVRMPHKLLYACCYVLALAGAAPLIKYLTFSAHEHWRVRLLENFDWLSPPFQHHHTKEEVLEWLQKEGFERIGMLSHGFIPKVGILGKKLLK